MKKSKLLIITLICLFVVNVKADMGPPMIAEHEVMVTNKNGAACYLDGKKTGEVLAYGKTYTVSDDINGNYISVYDSNGNGCTVKYSDVSAKKQSYDLSSAKEITPIKAVILANGGLNMRKGPSVTYSKVVTIPQ